MYLVRNLCCHVLGQEPLLSCTWSGTSVVIYLVSNLFWHVLGQEPLLSCTWSGTSVVIYLVRDLCCHLLGQQPLLAYTWSGTSVVMYLVRDLCCHLLGQDPLLTIGKRKFYRKCHSRYHRHHFMHIYIYRFSSEIACTRGLRLEILNTGCSNTLRRLTG